MNSVKKWKVKRSEHGVIVDPYISIRIIHFDADDLMVKYDISGIPVTVDGKLVGIITNRDMRFETDLSRPISRNYHDERRFDYRAGEYEAGGNTYFTGTSVENLPLIDKDGYLKGLID